MPHISQIDYEAASEAVREAHDEEVRLRGHVTNMKNTLLHSPPAYRAYMEWYTLKDELAKFLPDRAWWLYAHAISSGSECLLCTLFFRRALAGAGIDPETFAPDEEEQLLIDFGTAISRDSAAIPEDLWTRLKARYDEAQRVNLVAFAGLMKATNLFNNAVGVTIDPELEPFRKA